MPSELTSVATRVSLADFTGLELIVPRLQESDAAGIIEELSQRLRAQQAIGDVLSFYHAAVNHELLSNSDLPTGIAIPHARSDQVRRLTLAVGRAREPVGWGGKSSRPVEWVFLIAVPATDASGYLALLASLAGLSRRPEMLARLHAATAAESVLEILEEIPVGAC